MVRRLKWYESVSLLFVVILLGAVSMSNADQKSHQPPTVAEAEAFIKNAEARLLELTVHAGRADWVKSTYITDDTEILAAQADERAIESFPSTNRCPAGRRKSATSAALPTCRGGPRLS